MSSDEQEAQWQRQLYESRKGMVKCVTQVLVVTSPTRRRAIYEQWRQQYGDSIARTRAKYAEACIAGTVSLKNFLAMVEGYEKEHGLPQWDKE